MIKPDRGNFFPPEVPPNVVFKASLKFKEPHMRPKVQNICTFDLMMNDAPDEGRCSISMHIILLEPRVFFVAARSILSA